MSEKKLGFRDIYKRPFTNHGGGVNVYTAEQHNAFDFGKIPDANKRGILEVLNLNDRVMPANFDPAEIKVMEDRIYYKGKTIISMAGLKHTAKIKKIASKEDAIEIKYAFRDWIVEKLSKK